MKKLKEEVLSWIDSASQENRRSVSQWVYADDGKLFIRLTNRYINNEVIPSIDVANIEIDEEYQGKGLFKELLSEIEIKAEQLGRCVYVESVLNDMLINVLPRYGYEEVHGSIPPSFVKLKNEVKAKVFKI